jgi:hypothetical protein
MEEETPLCIYIEDFQTHHSFYNIPDETACQVFPLTLKEEACEWFDSLESIDSFSTIKRQFLDRFSAIQKKKQHPASVFSLKQGHTKSLTNFVRRFNQELQLVENLGEEIILSAMINGMKTKEPLMTELAQGSTMCTLHQFMSKIKVYMQKEKAIKVFEKTDKPLNPVEQSLEGRGIFFEEKEKRHHHQQRARSTSKPKVDSFERRSFSSLHGSSKGSNFKPPPKMRTSPM